jgi:predicted RNA-binding Zn-ribbon protein involved in translation (DUF1610 family)
MPEAGRAVAIRPKKKHPEPRGLKFPGGYIHPEGYVCAAVCFEKNGRWIEGYKFGHRENFQAWYGIALTSNEVIHFIDDDRSNTHWRNLSRLTRSKHLAIARGKSLMLGLSRLDVRMFSCPECGAREGQRCIRIRCDGTRYRGISNHQSRVNTARQNRSLMSLEKT